MVFEEYCYFLFQALDFFKKYIYNNKTLAYSHIRPTAQRFSVGKTLEFYARRSENFAGITVYISRNFRKVVAKIIEFRQEESLSSRSILRIKKFFKKIRISPINQLNG